MTSRVSRADGSASGAGYNVVDGVMLDTSEYLCFIEPVWHLEVARDSGVAVKPLRQLKQATAANVKAPRSCFPARGSRREKVAKADLIPELSKGSPLNHPG